MKIKLTDNLKAEYLDLWYRCKLVPEREKKLDFLVKKINNSYSVYNHVGVETKVPWWVVGCIHILESDGNFNTHLYNGDPLTARTVHEPKGRPVVGSPPFAWEESAIDSLKYENFDKWGDWSIPGTLYRIESYNGFGYRRYHPECLSPYLWAGTNLYTKGKYGSDGRFNPELASKEIGVVPLLKLLQIFMV